MPSSTATSTAVAAAPVYGRLDLDLAEVNSMLSGHRDYINKTKAKVDPHESSENECSGRRDGYPNEKTVSSAHHPTSLHAADPHSAAHHVADDEKNGAADGRPQLRPWKAEHRVSMGPEKVWSIGAGDSGGAEDGQVEKSISEVLAGVEHNNRSRKASHSLRFFKEGLPEEKGKRKDQRSSHAPREKSPSRGEKLPNIQEQPAGGESADAQALGDSTSISELHKRTPDSKTIQGSPGVHSAPQQGESAQGPVVAAAVTAEPVSYEHELGGQEQQGLESEDSGRQSTPKPRPELDLGVGAGESVEEGEDSGEEKISSAVFLPHQAPEESPESSPVPGMAQRMAPSRRHSRHGDFHPWLVKADEPEVDDEQRSPSNFEGEVVPEAADYSSVAPEVAYRQAEDSAPVAQREPAAAHSSSRLSHPASHYEDAVHEHHWTPKQPLEAIELIPYKHQVGGHTTLWRFSRRAVCKQLNNRENEFYEKIEKYHRDLLAFLPRYIGVLNVTFQKQPRRKSAVKREDGGEAERSRTAPNESPTGAGNDTAQDEAAQQTSETPRVVSQSMKQVTGQVPTVTFVDNQHILPRNLLQPAVNSPNFLGRLRSVSASDPPTASSAGPDAARPGSEGADGSRPNLQERHANSWGATTVNKKLRNEVFNDAFLKQPIAIRRHRKGHQRVPRRTQSLRPSGSDPSLIESHEKQSQPARPMSSHLNGGGSHAYAQSDVGQAPEFCDDDDAPQDVTGTSAPEPEIPAESSPAQKKKRRYSGSGLRRKPKDVQDDRGDLQYFEEADDAKYKANGGDSMHTKRSKPTDVFRAPPESEAAREAGAAAEHRALAPAQPSAAPLEYSKIPRPVNPKEAQTQRDSRVEYFLLLEDLTAGMKRPCIMDLKMGTRQYGVDASPKKQKSQQGKCAKTTSRELGVRVCGLQVWNVKTQSYIFKDKYYGRELKRGPEFQAALTRFLYNGVDRSSILRHIPTVLQKLDELEVIIKRLRGYRFYAASLLMFYDGDTSADTNGNNHYVEDSTTDFATDTEEAPRRTRRNPREIDFKMADFANCVTAGDLSARDRPCPPRHPDEPDRGFLRGLRSLRRYFLRIQRDTRAEMGLATRNGNGNGSNYEEIDTDMDEDEGSVSE
ncbi:hypothetical protein VTH82DRAFT_309 [Thermothelomyces myriococcoides]